MALLFYCENKCDPVGIQTQDLQNRNLTLYSAKLRDPQNQRMQNYRKKTRRANYKCLFCGHKKGQRCFETLNIFNNDPIVAVHTIFFSNFVS